VPIADEPAARLAFVARRAGLDIPEEAERVESWSNEVWDCGEFLVRVCHWSADPERLVREALIGAALPESVCYPRVLDAGHAEGVSWTVVRRVAGTPLSRRWKALDASRLRSLIAQLAEVLHALHSWEPTPDVVAALRAHDAAAPLTDGSLVAGHDLLPLPAPRWHAVADTAMRLPFVDAGVVRAVAARLDELAGHDPFAAPYASIVHCDVNFSNLLEHDGVLTALLDYEWARLGPPDADLVSFLWSAGSSPRPASTTPPVVRWLAADYPELFSAPDLRERLWMTELAYGLRQLVVWPPKDATVARDDLVGLARLVEAPWSY
jgi:aminoglycoside phosphotransferase (APT) family kinase protein